MFKPGDTVQFDPSAFSKEYWDSLSQSSKIEYYGELGYGKRRPVLFTFLCEHRQQAGHCVIVSMENQKVITMVHTNELRLSRPHEYSAVAYIPIEE